MHMVDDATGTVLCQFSAGETTWAAAHLLRAWIERYGVPRALYTDWKNVYVRLPNVQERLRGEAAVTQFGQLPLPLQPHPRNLRLRQAGLIALLPAIILGDKAGRI